ncbi:MAG TPA: biopolymer transporter ExbD [Pirellulaceae bacterium]|nr:biopolymer transporter ExbD [Pirellulaceae bacterium]
MPLKANFDEEPTLNLTPMIDVVFQLIVFFMVGTRFASVEHRIGVTVPQVRQAGPQVAVAPKQTVHISKDGQMLLGEQPVTLEELTARLKAMRATTRDLSVVVRGDGDGALRYVASALAACRQAGVTDLGISVRVAQGGAAGGRSTPGR